MGELDTAWWAAGIAALATLLGVGLGGWLTYITTKKVSEQQAKEQKQIRKVAQLERLNRVLERINDQFLGLSTAATMTVNFGERQQIDKVDDASLAELEFLTRVYLPEGRLYFVEIQSLQILIKEKLTEIYTSTPDQLALKMPLTQIRKLEINFRDSIEHLREALVESARAIERN